MFSLPTEESAMYSSMNRYVVQYNILLFDRGVEEDR